MSSVKGVPSSLQEDLKPSAEVHRIGVTRDANITEITRGVAGGDIHAAAQGNRQMGKIAADANPLAKTIERGAIGASFLIIESEMAMDKVANRLNPLPAGGCLAKSPPSEIHKLAVNL